MKFFQHTSLLILTIFVAVFAQEEHVNCDAICNERVQQAIQPITDEKVRAEEWGHAVRRELDEAIEKMRGFEAEIGQLRQQVADRDHWVNERDQLIREKDQAIQASEASVNELRGKVENSQRSLEGSKREIDQVKHDSSVELDLLRTKAEESSRSLGRVQYALDEAADQIKEMEAARISVNLKGIQEDVRVYWKNLLGWWTGLVMPDKKNKDEDL